MTKERINKDRTHRVLVKVQGSLQSPCVGRQHLFTMTMLFMHLHRSHMQQIRSMTLMIC